MDCNIICLLTCEGLTGCARRTRWPRVGTSGGGGSCGSGSSLLSLMARGQSSCDSGMTVEGVGGSNSVGQVGHGVGRLSGLGVLDCKGLLHGGVREATVGHVVEGLIQ